MLAKISLSDVVIIKGWRHHDAILVMHRYRFIELSDGRLVSKSHLCTEGDRRAGGGLQDIQTLFRVRHDVEKNVDISFDLFGTQGRMTEIGKQERELLIKRPLDRSGRIAI